MESPDKNTLLCKLIRRYNSKEKVSLDTGTLAWMDNTSQKTWIIKISVASTESLPPTS